MSLRLWQALKAFEEGKTVEFTCPEYEGIWTKITEISWDFEEDFSLHEFRIKPREPEKFEWEAEVISFAPPTLVGGWEKDSVNIRMSYFRPGQSMIGRRLKFTATEIE
jgi:hypothetical protein